MHPDSTQDLSFVVAHKLITNLKLACEKCVSEGTKLLRKYKDI